METARPGGLPLTSSSTPDGPNRARRHLEGKLGGVTDECDRLAEAIGRGGRLTALLGRLTRLERRAEAIRAELAAYPATAPDVRLRRARASRARQAGRLARPTHPERRKRKCDASDAARRADPVGQILPSATRQVQSREYGGAVVTRDAARSMQTRWRYRVAQLSQGPDAMSAPYRVVPGR